MNKYLALATFSVALGLAACATDPKATTAPASQPAGSSKDSETITGSRIPTKSSGSSVQSVSGEAWRRETTQTIGNAPRGN